jgi:predicted nucleotide-binding protein (sugar kinase/HSP70/actin superfamily)
VIDVTQHYLRPEELPFQAAERSHVTILFGGLTWKHELMIQSVLRRSGLQCQRLPEPDRLAHEIGKEYCSNGLCNPAYFTVGNLIQYLRVLERTQSREEIVRNYLFFSASSDGPCRFGMYEAEFRAALNAAGYNGFRVLGFQQDDGVNAKSGHSGMKFNVDFGMDALHAFILGDLLNTLHRRLRPYEANDGDAQRTVETIAAEVARTLEKNPYFELSENVPQMLRPFVERHRTSRAYRIGNTAGKILNHLYGKRFFAALTRCRQSLNGMETDWLRVKPLVKVIGEFWAQETEGDGNYQMFRFLEREGAEVSVEPISNWVLYLLHQSNQRGVYRSRLLTHIAPWKNNPLAALKKRLAAWGKRSSFAAGEGIYLGHYARLEKALLGEVHRLPSQAELAELSDQYYSSKLRGGEGHLEVAKNLYYTKHRLCHMVLALKPFGCLPSLQSDAVQAGLAERFPEMVFLSVETSADGEIHAYSRVQMALAEARVKAQAEFESALKQARQPLADIRRFVAQHPELRSPMYRVTRRPGVISTAANFVLDVDDLMRSSGGQGSISCRDLIPGTLEGQPNSLRQEA